jgi:lipoate synthase
MRGQENKKATWFVEGETCLRFCKVAMLFKNCSTETILDRTEVFSFVNSGKSCIMFNTIVYKVKGKAVP